MPQSPLQNALQTLPKAVPQAAAPSPAPVAAPQAPQATSNALDPRLVALAQSIRQVESGGNFQAKGKSGEYGAYQFMPETWNANAPRFGVNVPLTEATPQQQNEVAYKQLQEWAQEHPNWNVGNFASAWNAGPGKADAYLTGNSGINKQGVSYDTAAYAKRVAEAYQTIKQQQTVAAPNQVFSSQGNSGAPSVGGFLGNTLQSGANFLGNLIGAAAHPIQTSQNILEAGAGAFQELGGQQNENTAKFDALKNYFADRYKSPDALLHTAYTDPVGLAADISTILGVGGGAVGLAGKAADVAGLSTLGDAAATASERLGAASTLTNPITPVAAGAGALLKAGSGPLGSIASKFTEISAKSMGDIIANPQDYTPEAIANTSRISVAKEVEAALNERDAALSETGSGYEPIKQGVSEGSGVSVQGKNAIPVQQNFLEHQLRKVAKVGVEDGNITANGSSVVRASKDVRALQNLLDTWKPEFQKGYLTPEEFLNFRQDLAGAAKFDREFSSSKPVEQVAAQIRSSLNESYRGAIPGLQELDASYAAQRASLDTLRKGILDKEGNLLKTAVNKIANATGKGKDLQLQQLEEILPGITRKIQILKTMQEIEDASGLKVGAYEKSITEAGGVIAGISTGNLPLLAGSLAVAIVTSPKIAVPLLRLYGMNKGLVSRVMANLARYATTGAVANQIASQIETPQTQSQADTQALPQDANPSTEINQVSS